MSPPVPARRPLSLRHLSLWLGGLATLLVLGCSVLLLSSAMGVLSIAETGGRNAAPTLLGHLRTISSLEKLVQLGDQLQVERDPQRARALARTLQALAYQPAHELDSEELAVVQRSFALADELLVRPIGSGVSPWVAQRAALLQIADDHAAALVRHTTGITESISASTRTILVTAVLGALIGMGGLIALTLFLRRQLIRPMLALSDYLSALRRGDEKRPPLPRPPSREVAEVFEAMDRLAETQQALQSLALRDSLTGLLNRYALDVRLTHALARARREQGCLALMFIDLDNFKQINDTLGHDVGDALLQHIARRLAAGVRERDTVARLGGDEFIVLLDEVSSPAAAARVADKLIEAVAEPVVVGPHTLLISASVGISLYPDDADNASTLMKHADIALFHAKSLGRGNSQYFDEQMNRRSRERVQLEAELRSALQEGQLSLHFQPQTDASGQRVTGVEALLRWRQRDGSMVPPTRFIPVAEDCGLIEPIGRWVLEEACRTLQRWRAAGLTDLVVAVNLSALQLRSPGLAGQVAEVLAATGLPPACLEVEVTESMAMADPETTIGNLQALSNLGVAAAIDDFGTGYSSLAYLKLLPIRRIKLDRTFVKDIESDPNDAAICAATIGLAHNLGLEVVAEGVETSAQMDYLQQLGCDFLQGYLFSPPRPASDAFEFIHSHHLASAALEKARP